MVSSESSLVLRDVAPLPSCSYVSVAVVPFAVVVSVAWYADLSIGLASVAATNLQRSVSWYFVRQALVLVLLVVVAAVVPEVVGFLLLATFQPTSATAAITTTTNTAIRMWA